MIYISSSVNETSQMYLSSGQTVPFLGLLIGIEVEERVDVFHIVLVSEEPDTYALLDQALSVQHVLPAGFDVVGLIFFGEDEKITTDLQLVERVGIDLCQNLNRDEFFVLSVVFGALCTGRLDFEKPLQERVQRFDAESGRLEYTCGETIFWKRYTEMTSKRVTVRLKMSFAWSFNYQETWNAEEMEREIRRYFDRRLSNLLLDKQWYIGFRNSEKMVMMMEVKEDTPRIIGSAKELTLMEVYGQLTGLTKRKELSFHQDVIDGSFLEKVTASEANSDSANIVPIVQYEAGEFLHANIPQCLDVLVICGQDCKLSDLPSLVLESYRRVCCLRLKQFLKFSHLEKKQLSIIEPFTFLPSQLGHFVLAYYPAASSDKELESERSQLHSILDIPTDRPLFRKSNQFRFPDERGPYLIDVHQSVRDPGINASITGIVHGHYQYRHYMQDNFEDKNWGCAYRSFQTIWSWFLLNGYTEKPVPTHREIQQALVDVGDREPKFVGSRQWIGSLELSYCLSHLADVTSKIVSVSSGDEMGQKARELIHHFRTDGTPVMIGGGVLAHTILGVAYNEESGEAKFLVLDPHYTGDENIQTIVDKGWCGWKPVSFWDANAFYNMMLPLRPKEF